MAIRVLIVDDSAVVREIMQAVLSKHRDIEILGASPNPIFAMERMKTDWPDVMLLDIEMPRMDGITFLKQIMSTRPTPVIICSSLTGEGAEVTMQALAAGAFGIITKPALGVRDFLQESESELISTIRAAAQAKVSRLLRTAPLTPPPATAPLPVRPTLSPPPSAHATTSPGASMERMANERLVTPKLSADVIMEAPGKNDGLMPTTENIVAIGTSTGGTQALETVLTALPRNCPGVVVVQHMPEKFTQSFAARLNSLSNIEVREAKSGDRVLPGQALIAPGGKHMLVKRNGAQYYVDVIDGPLVSRHRPSVDVLFRSMAKNAGRNGVGIIMTGMGDDGAKGLKEMSDTGAVTYAQDEATCVVFGMPKEAIGLGGIKEVLPLERISGVIERYGR